MVRVSYPDFFCTVLCAYYQTKLLLKLTTKIHTYLFHKFVGLFTSVYENLSKNSAFMKTLLNIKSDSLFKIYYNELTSGN